MIIGIGTDICNIERIVKSINKFGVKFINRVCTPEETEELSKRKRLPQSLAKIFAAKEACAKALGTGFDGTVCWHDIEIFHDEKGKPYIKVNDKVKSLLSRKAFRIELSLSDDDPYAVAFVIIETIDEGN